MRARLTALLLLCLAALTAPGGAVTAAAASGPGETECAPYFPLQDGWLGGDAAYSVVLPGGRVLWLFGDSFIGPQAATSRRKAALIGNSIGLSDCRRGAWSIGYYWRRGDGGPEAFFLPPGDGARPAGEGAADQRYWPLDGFAHEGAVYVFLSRVRTRPDDALGFRIEGVDLVKIEGLELSPAEWRLTYRPVRRGGDALPGAAVLRRPDHVLLYTPLTGKSRPKRPVALARLSYAGLEAPARNLQHLDRAGRWRAGFDPQRARRIFEQGATELSVHETADGNRFVAVLNESAFPADRIVLRTAPAPEGPWTQDTAVELIAERTRIPPERQSRVFCYAGKAYEPATRATTLMLTYVCNSTDADLLLRDLGLYRPLVKRVALPRAP